MVEMIEMVEAARPLARPARAPQALDSADLDTAAVDALAARLDPAAQAVVGLYLACRLEGERYPDCFARLGAPTYAALLHEALRDPAPA